MKILSLLVLTTALLLPASLRAQSHGHLNAGVADANNNGIPDAGEKLAFVNADEYDAASGFILELTQKLSGRYAGTFSGNLTFTALGIDPLVGGPEPGHAAAGTHIVVQLVGVTGPAGGTFSFWDAAGSSPFASLAVGGTTSEALRWNLSENDGLPGEDPYGHVHGRQFSVDQPGTYTVTFQLFDTSTNGAGGGAIHAPGDLFQMTFVAVPEPGTITLLLLAAAGFGVAGRLRRR